MQVNKLALSEFKNELVDLIINVKNFIDISKYEDNLNQIDFNKIKITGYIEKINTDSNLLIVKIPLKLHNTSSKQLKIYKEYIDPMYFTKFPPDNYKIIQVDNKYILNIKLNILYDILSKKAISYDSIKIILNFLF